MKSQRAGRRTALRANNVAIVVAAAFAPWAYGQTPPPPNTLPTGGVITQGSGTIHAPVGSNLQIDQSSARMAAQFGSFSIGQSAHVNVSQPSSSSVALFKDVGGSLSQIYGGLTANGHIFISNQNGVLFGSSARVEVGSLFATNLSINETDFMDGRYNWYNDGATGTVTNQGTIITPSGYTVLAGPQVRNDGIIVARTGSIVLAAGDRVSLDLIGDGLISVSVDQAAVNASAINTGTINADGGTVMLTARSASALLDTVVNSGVIRATSLIERNGEIVLDAGPSGTVYATGETQATHVSVRGGGLRVERLVPDPMFLNGMIAGDTINVDVTDAVLVERGGQITSRFGQSITAGSLTIRGQQPGEFSTVRNETGNQAITVTGANGILVEATNGGGAILGKPFVFGVPAADSQTISATRFQVEGGSIQANEQNITVSGDFSLRNGAASTLGGNQTITVTGGNVDLRGASISSGAAQSITVTGGDHITVVGEAGFAGLQASFGPQTVSITGTGANAINIDGATVNGLNQTITAGNPGESGSITITGSSNSNGFSHIANIGVGVASPQTVRTSGTLTITGGPARAAGIFQNNPAEQRISAASVVLQGGPSGSGNGAFINSTFGGGQHFNVPGEIRLTGGVGGAAGIFNGTNTPLPGTSTPQTNSAPQTINAGSVVLRGGAGGSDNGAFINSTFGGNQTLTVPGEIRVTGGDGGTGNRAGIITNANQTITGNPSVVLAGGAGSGNSAFIQATGDETKVQVMNARAISLVGGAGADASATLNAVRQNIATTTGDVSLLAGAGLNAGARIGGLGSTLGPTNLTLTVGGDLLLRGGAGDGVSLGSNAASTQANNITVNALSGDVILEAGTGGGARIGASGNAPAVNPGNITVTAGGSLQIGEGTGIRANGPITLTANSLTNDGTVSNGGGANTGNVILNANAFDLADGNIQGGTAAVALRPRTGTNSFGIESAGATTISNADIASIQTDNFIIFGSSTGTIFTGNMTIGENARVEGNGKNLAFSRSLAPSAEMITIGSQGVATTGDVILGAGGGGIRSNGGTVTGDEVVLRATTGIGTPTARVKTAANALALNNAGGGGVFVSELDNVTLRTISLNAGGPLTVSNTNNGSVSLISGGDVNVAGLVSSGGSMILDAGGNLRLEGTAVDTELRSSGGQAISAQSINLTAQNGRRVVIQNQGGLQELTARSGGMDLEVAGGAGVAQIVSISSPFLLADQTINVAGQLNVLGGATGGSTNSGIFQNGTGLQTVNAAGITLQGASTGTNAGAGIRSQGDQVIDVSGDINLRGGNGGTNNSAFLAANPTTPGVVGNQTIHARHINMSNGTGGVDTTSTITAGKQLIDASGNVTLTAEGALVGGAPGGPGVRIGAPGGTPLATDLTLLVGANLVLNGGSAVENGASIGSSGAAVPPTPNTIRIEAGGDVIMNAGNPSGTGVRIGSGSSGTAGGSISVRAARTIQMNGSAQRNAAIRSLGNVTLDAASIVQTGTGLIQADLLTVKTAGAANLVGANDVARFNATSGGPLTLVDAGSLQATGISTTNDTITLTTDSLTNSGVIGNGGGTSTANIVLNADTFNLADGTVEGGAAAVILRPRTGTNSFGIESFGQTTLTNADIASIHTSDFVVFGSGMGTTFTGNMAIGQNGRVEGGDKNLAFFRSSVPGGTTTVGIGGVNTTGNVIVSAGGGAIVSEGGTVSGDQVQLRASQGIGSQFMRVQTAANRLALNHTGPQGAFVFENGDVTLGNVNLMVGGIANNVANLIGGGGSYDVLAAGSITVSDLIQAGSVALGTSSGSITEVGAGAIVANDLRTFSGQSTILGGANQVHVFNASAGGGVLLANTGSLNVDSMAGTDVTITNHGAMTIGGFWNSAADTSVTTTGAGSDLTVTGFVTSGGAMDLDVDGALRVTAGALQNATLQSSGGQNITAASVEVTSHDGGFASLTNLAGDQTISATAGAIEVQSSGASGFAILSNNGGAQNLQATGGPIGLRTAGNSSAQISNFGAGDQSITVSGAGLEIEHTLGGTGFATLVNAGAASQHIVVSGPGGIDVTTVGGGSAGIANAAPGTQTIQVTDADHISVNGVGGFASISSAGLQEISITGQGANALTVGSTGALGGSSIFGASQVITAGAAGELGSITITGGDASGRVAALSTQAVADGMQSVSTSGVLRVTGGNASAQNLNAGLFHAGSGAQTVSAARIELHGGAAGNNNGALIVSGNGAQNINVSDDLVIAGGAGGNAGISGPAARLQTIRAANIHMTNSAAGGFNSVGFILGGHQNIGVTGDLTMTARASGGDLPGVRIGGLSGAAATATDLMLTVGGDLVLTGGTVAGNGVGIGSTAAPGPGFANNIIIDAGGDVILNSGAAGSGARIGSSATTGAAAGDISITAGGDIRLNGVAENAAIRTLGNVTLDAASISEAARGLIEAGTLHTRTSGDALLTGANRVSSFTAESDHGNVALTNTSAVLSLGAMDLPGNLAIVQTGDVTLGSATASSATLISAAGDISMSASGQIVVRGSDTTFGAGSAVLAGGDLDFSAGDVTLLAGDAALTPVVVRGGDGVEMTLGNELRVTGGRGLLSPALLTSGGDIELTIGRAVRVDAGTGFLSVARVQTETKDGVIRLVFPELSHGGYFVNGVEGRISQGQTGFYSLLKPAKVGKTLLLDYGN